MCMGIRRSVSKCYTSGTFCFLQIASKCSLRDISVSLRYLQYLAYGVVVKRLNRTNLCT